MGPAAAAAMVVMDMDELVEDFLLRSPPDDPAQLVRAALVLKRWRRILADGGFRRRYRERHRTPPMLGLLHLHGSDGACFTAVSSFRPRDADLRGRWYALDSRHGRVLLASMPLFDEPSRNSLAVWNPIRGDRLELPQSPPPPPRRYRLSWNAAVLCPSGDCDHLDCHHGPFLVVLVGTTVEGVSVDVYSSEAGAWSRPTFRAQNPIAGATSSVQLEPSILANNVLYFVAVMEAMPISIRILLGYNLGTRKIHWVHIPFQMCPILLTATEYGSRLGLATLKDSRVFLCSLCSREEGPDRRLVWAFISRIIELEKLIPANTHLISVAGFVHGFAVVFVRTSHGLFRIDLKSGQAKKVCEDSGFNYVVPYMSFCTPALREVSSGGACVKRMTSLGLSRARFLNQGVSMAAALFYCQPYVLE